MLHVIDSLSLSLFLCLSLLQVAVDVLEGLLEEDDEVVQVSNEIIMAQLFCLVKKCGDKLLFIFLILFEKAEFTAPVSQLRNQN